MLRHRSSLASHFNPKASVICFPSVKGRFCSPSVPIYRSSGSNRASVTKKRPAGADRFLFYAGASRGVLPNSFSRCHSCFRSIFLQPSLSILVSHRSSGNSQAVLESVCFRFQRLVWEFLKTVQNNKWDTIKQSKMCRIENVEEIFELQPSLTIIKIDKQQRNDRGVTI